jgi:beta-phosphoglucomutase
MESIMEKIEAVIFDMDGTLFDTERLSFGFYKKALKKYGYVMNKEIYISLMGRKRKDSSKILIEKYGEDLPIEKIYEEKDKEMLKYIHENGVPVKIGVYELLEFLVKRGYKVALATSTYREKAVDLLERAGIRDKFRAIICGDDVMNSKPAPDIFLKAAEKLETDPKRCIVLEDSPVGIEAAYNGGIMAINIPDLKEPDEEVERFSYKIFDSLLEVRDYLKRSNLDLSL